MKNKIMLFLLLLPLALVNLNSQIIAKYEYDDHGNRTRMYIPAGCDCDCPEESIRNEWVTFTAERGKSPCSPDEYKITHTFHPDKIESCFKFYKVENGDELSGFYPIPTNDQLQGVQGCIQDLKNYSIKVHFYESTSDATPCVVSKVPELAQSCCDFVDMALIKQDNCNFRVQMYANQGDCDLSSMQVYMRFANGFETTLADGAEFSINASQEGMLKYSIVVDGEKCYEREMDIDCNRSGCPKSRNQWLELIVDKFGSDCSTDECAVYGRIIIPDAYREGYKAYNRTDQVIDKDYNVVASKSKTVGPFSIDDPFQELPCLAPGEKIKITITLLDVDGNPTDCTIERGPVFCETMGIPDKDEVICDKDDNNPWKPGKVHVKLGDCVFMMSYSSRRNSAGQQDVTITNIESIGECAMSVDIEALFQGALPKAIFNIIKNNGDWHPQIEENDCYDTWRVIQKACWSQWRSEFAGKTVVEYVPCESACCARKLRVCLIDGKLTVTDLGIAYNPPNLAGCGDPVQPPLGETSDCMNTACDMYSGYSIGEDTGNYGDDNVVGPPNNQPLKEGINTYGSDDLLIKYRMYHSLTELNIDIARSSLKEVQINIYNSYGQVVGTTKHNLNKSAQLLSIDISSLQSGTYFIKFVTESKVFGNNKFQIVR